MRDRQYGARLFKIVSIALAILVAVIGFGELFSSEQRAIASVFGPSASHTNAPGEDNCTSCHVDFPVNGSDGSISISGLPPNYLPGQQIPVTVTVNQAPNAIIFGFQMTAIDSTGQRVGTYTIPPGVPPAMQIISGIVGGHNRDYIEHTQNGVLPIEFGTKSWTFTFNAPALRAGKIRFFAAGNAADSDNSTSGDRIYTTSGATLSGSAIANYDLDTKSDIAVYRPSNGTWYSLSSTNFEYNEVGWGLPGDIMAPGDFDGDGLTDYAVWRPANSTWYIRTRSGSFSEVPFGVAGDIPVAADYDGDLKTDIAVWRPSNATWHILRSSNGAYINFPFGLNGDRPVPADYDGDAKADAAVFRPADSTWHRLASTTGGYSALGFGLAGDEPVQGDYDGDGRADTAVYRPSTSVWYVLTAAFTYHETPFGLVGDKPAPADFDGDGKTDIAVYRENTWYFLGSEQPSFWFIQFGLSGDIPVPRGYIPQ